MNKFLFPILIALTACSPQNKIETSTAKPTETTAEKNSGDMVKQAEFIADGKTYFINGGESLMDQVEKNRLSSGSYNVTLNNVCIQGKVLTKEQNQGNGFGPLGKYSQAVTVESLC